MRDEDKKNTLFWCMTKYAQEFMNNEELQAIRDKILRHDLYSITTKSSNTTEQDKEEPVIGTEEYKDYYDAVAEAHHISMIYSVKVSINNRFSEHLFTLMYDMSNDKYVYEIPEVKKDNTKNEILEEYLRELCGIADYLSLEFDENDTAEKINRVCNKIRDLFNKNN